MLAASAKEPRAGGIRSLHRSLASHHRHCSAELMHRKMQKRSPWGYCYSRSVVLEVQPINQALNSLQNYSVWSISASILHHIYKQVYQKDSKMELFHSTLLGLTKLMGAQWPPSEGKWAPRTILHQLPQLRSKSEPALHTRGTLCFHSCCWVPRASRIAGFGLQMQCCKRWFTDSSFYQETIRGGGR